MCSSDLARGNITVDERTNTLIVQDTADKLGEIRSLVQSLDIPVRQVLIESRIVIANEDDAVVLHAGWRGLANGIIAAGIDSLEGVPEVALIGPAISVRSYEVSADLLNEHDDFPSHATHTSDKPHLDLRSVAHTQLVRGGVKEIVAASAVTDGGATFYSARSHNPTGRFALIAVRS